LKLLKQKKKKKKGTKKLITTNVKFYFYQIPWKMLTSLLQVWALLHAWASPSFQVDTRTHTLADRTRDVGGYLHSQIRRRMVHVDELEKQTRTVCLMN